MGDGSQEDVSSPIRLHCRIIVIDFEIKISSLNTNGHFLRGNLTATEKCQSHTFNAFHSGLLIIQMNLLLFNSAV